MKYRVHIVDADDPLTDTKRPIVYKLKEDVNFPRNFYVTLHGNDQDISFQYATIVELDYSRDLRLRDRLVTIAAVEEYRDSEDKYIFFQKEHIEMTTVYEVNSHFKKCKFYCARIKGADLPESMTEDWPIIKFEDIFDAKEEYAGYIAGKNYGI
jgi:hypothetical protein